MRYQRQEILSEIGESGQALLREKTAVLVGLGAIGSVAAELLVRSGVSVVLIDGDTVEEENLHRQTLYSEQDIEQKKVEAGSKRLIHVNPDCVIRVIPKNLTKKNLHNLSEGDIILDCTDNLETRHLLNQYCLKKKLPWVHAAAIRTQGVVYPVLPDGPCFNCVYRESKHVEFCDGEGVLPSITSAVASLQVAQALKILLGRVAEKKLVRIDVWRSIFDKITVKKDPNCQSCSKLKSNDIPRFRITLCRSKAAYVIRPLKQIRLNLGSIKKHYPIKISTPFLIVLDVEGKQVIVHNYGELVFKNSIDKEFIQKTGEEIYRVGR